MERKPNRRRQQQIRMAVITAMVVVAIIAAILYLTVGRLAGDQTGGGELSKDYTGKEAASTDSAQKAQNTIVYDGKRYAYNDHLTNYLLMGVDTSGSIQEEKEPGSAGQSDWIMLVSYDRAEETSVALGIPRETFAQIALFTPGGKSIGMSQDFLTIQYAYGDGRHESCRLTAEAVSRLMNGIPINGYAAINTSSIPKITDLVGGVEVVVPDDSLVEKDPAFKKGSTVLLDSSNTETFIRSRDTNQILTTEVRRNRQKVFVNAFATKLAQEQRRDASTVTTLYETMKPDMVTTMGTDDFAKLALSDWQGGVQTIPGTETHEGNYDVFRVDDAELYKLIIQLFYKEVPS
ncbi:MAG: LCP family protein [Lachnospiraceae bacterium]|nr:LCP family protein [Lachnospiraceae bacterium]